MADCSILDSRDRPQNEVYKLLGMNSYGNIQ